MCVRVCMCTITVDGKGHMFERVQGRGPWQGWEQEKRRRQVMGSVCLFPGVCSRGSPDRDTHHRVFPPRKGM